MAQPKTAAWTKLLIQVGDGAQSETFSQPCALVTKGLDLSADTSDSNVPDCDNPDSPSWTQRVVRALSGQIAGSGRLALASHTIWRTWFLSGASKNVRIKIDVAGADGGGTYVGAFVLTKFGLSGNESDGKVGVDATILSDGPIAWTGAP